MNARAGAIGSAEADEGDPLRSVRAHRANLADMVFGSLSRTAIPGSTPRDLAFLPKEALELDLADPAQRAFGDYELLEQIGEGGMGVVYRARQISLDREVAVKLLAAGPWASKEYVERFRREAQNAARMQHPNIVAIYEVGSTEELHFFSMRLIHGGNLSALIREKGKLAPRRAAMLLRTIAEAVDYAHRLGVLHLDLKPGNVLLDENGVPHVADFGLARRLDNTLATENEDISGTPSYMAPERAQVRNQKITAAADIWGLGAILYELVAGEPPFIAATPQATLKLLLEGRVRNPRRHAPDLPRDLEAIILKCMAREPSARYARASDLADDLDHFIKRQTVRKRRLATLAIIVLAFAGGLGVATWQSWQASSATRSIAVLPFVDRSANKDQDYLGDGISEELLTTLAKVEGLRVAARTSSFAFKNTTPDVRQIGEKLHVGSVLEGSVRRDGKHLHVTAELIDAASGFELWSDAYEREVDDVLAVQDKIARAIIDALKIKLAVALPKHKAIDPEAYDLYLQGVFFSNKSSEEGLRHSLELFERSLRKDPRNADAWSGIAKVWNWLSDAYVRPLDAYPQSKDAALKALALDPDNATAHAYLSDALRVLDRDVAGADRELQHALQLDPNSSDVLLFLALLRTGQGNLAEGVRLIQQALKIDPLSPIISNFAAMIYLCAGRYDDAIAAAKQTQRLDENYFYVSPFLANAYREQGRYEDAIAIYRKAEQATGMPQADLAVTYARMGRTADARRILAELEDRAAKTYVSGDNIAAIYVALGDNDNAFRWLERAFDEHAAELDGIGVERRLRPLHNDPRFAILLSKLGLDAQRILAND